MPAPYISFITVSTTLRLYDGNLAGSRRGSHSWAPNFFNCNSEVPKTFVCEIKHLSNLNCFNYIWTICTKLSIFDCWIGNPKSQWFCPSFNIRGFSAYYQTHKDTDYDLFETFIPVSPNVTWGGGSKIGQKSVTYYLNGPLRQNFLKMFETTNFI